jgi:hypothetical protein
LGGINVEYAERNIIAEYFQQRFRWRIVMDEKRNEIEEIEKEVNAQYTYINPFKAIEYMKTLLSKIKELETDDRSRSERFIEIGDKYESLKFKVFDLEEKVKTLQEERDGYKNGQIQLQGMVDDLMDVNAKWVGKVKGLENIKTQPIVPLVYCKEHKTICMPFKGELGCCLESRLKRLQEAVDRHEIFKRAHEKVVSLEDEELYQKRKEVI